MGKTKRFAKKHLWLPLALVCTCVFAVKAIGAECEGPRPTRERPAERVVGGQPALLKHWPGQAALRYHIDDKNQSFYFCGGTLISPRWMLTAAHCIADIYKQRPPYRKKLDAVKGSTMRGRGLVQVHYATESLAEPVQGRILLPRKIIPHPQYRASTRENDIALIELDGNAGASIARISASIDDNPQEPPGAMLMVAGFGNLEEGEPLQRIRRAGDGFALAGSGRLNEALLPLVGEQRCASRFTGKVIGEGHICAGYRTGIEDSCQGDSGGPLVAFDRQGCPYQVGIVSWGVGCGHPESYGVYTRLSHYVSWIRKVTAAEDNVNFLKAGQAIDWDTRAHLVAEADQAVTGIGSQLATGAQPVGLRILESRTGLAAQAGALLMGVKYRFELTAPITGYPLLVSIDDADGTISQLYPNDVAGLVDGNVMQAGTSRLLAFDRSPERALEFRAASLAAGRLLAMILPEDFDRALVLGDVLETASNNDVSAIIGLDYLYDLADQIRAVNGTSIDTAQFGYSVHPFSVQ